MVDEVGHVERALTATHEAFSDAIARGDATAAAAVYTDDAKVAPPDAGTLTGRHAAERFWRDWIEGGLCGIEHEPLLVESRGNAVYETGRSSTAVAPASAAASILRGRYLIVHERQPDGSWKWALDFFLDRPSERSEVTAM